MLWFVAGAVCAWTGAAGMPILEAWGIIIYVLPHTTPAQAVDQEEQSHIP